MSEQWNNKNNAVIDNQRQPGMNYKIVDGNDPESNLYAVYCSSNGIYYPDDEETFTKRIIEQDKYDWKRNIIKAGICKHIYIRDLYKQWYVEGINTEIDSIQKVADWIKTVTSKDAEFVFLGSSAGGYMSICLASLLGGTAFAGSPQVRLQLLDKYPLLIDNKDDPERNRWFDLRQVISRSKTNAKYFILYGVHNVEDRNQIAGIYDLPDVYTIQFNTDAHGVVFFPFNASEFYQKTGSLIKISNQKKVVNRLGFSIKVSGIKRTAVECTKKVLKPGNNV